MEGEPARGVSGDQERDGGGKEGRHEKDIEKGEGEREEK